MKAVGIIAEYNPFHNGHKYQIDYAKNVLKADYIVVAMSGSFTQRGTVACFDKYLRAKAALLNGADFVFEIPTVFATSSAREFATAGCRLLADTGIVDTLLFGAETDDMTGFKECAIKTIEIENSDDFNSFISRKLAAGSSYPEARASYMREHLNEAFISTSNNILGTEYVRSIIENHLPIEPVCMKRQGNEYNDGKLTGTMSSASAIRNALSEGIDISAQIPESCLSLYENADYINENDISTLLHYKLLCENDFSMYLDCSLDLSDRINKLKKEFISYSQFCELLKTKNLNYSRISRALCHILLNIKKDDFEEEKKAGYVKALRLLGFSSSGSEALKEIKTNCSVPLITGPDRELSKFDIYASDILRIVLTEKNKKSYPNEFTRKFDLANI